MLSIIFITFRECCKFEWFIQSILHQTTENLRKHIQIIVVDGVLENFKDQSERRKYFFN